MASMGSIGDCFDNAVAEAFWARMQVELLNRRRRRTRIELANALFEYLEIFHNRQRRHSSLDMRTPVEYEISREQPTRQRESSFPTPWNPGQTEASTNRSSSREAGRRAYGRGAPRRAGAG